MSGSGEGASLRSARTWLLLLCPEIPDRSGGNGAESVAVSRRHRRQVLGQVVKAPWHGVSSVAVDRGLWPIAAFGRRRPWIAAFGRRRRSRDRESMQCRSMNLGFARRACKAAGSACTRATCSFCDNTATNLEMTRPMRIWARNNYQATMCYRLFLVQLNQCATHHYTSWFCVTKLAF
jgi:hypothetical protein